jgi:DNA repair exonuclease SbcCD nuclease subunit
VRTFIAHGNHDPLDGWSAIREFPAGVHAFGHDAPETVEVEVDGQSVFVHGISYGTRDVRDNLAVAFRRASEPGLNVGVLHTNATGEAGHALYCPCTLEDLVACDMDYWALGHIHKQEILRERGPCIAYSGDTQGRSPKPSENGPKGVLVVEARGTTIDSVEFEPVDVVRFVTCSVDVSGVPDVAALLGVVAAEVEGLREEHAGRGLLVRVILRGRGPVASDLHHESGTDGFTAELRAHFSGHEPFVWIEAVKNQARSGFDFDAMRQRDDFAAELLKRYDGVGREGAEAAEAFVAQAADVLAKPGQVLTAVRAAEEAAAGEPQSEDEAAGILAEALERALELLGPEVTP